MAVQKLIVFFTFLLLFAFMEQTKLAMASEVNICERERRNLSCPPGKVIDILQASYGRQNGDTCPNSNEYTSNTNCHAGNSHAIVETTCKHEPSCELFADNSVFGDPCPGTYKYLRVTYECIDFFVLCEGSTGILRCPKLYQLMRVLQASYGRHDNTTCPDDNMTDTNCHSGNTHTIVSGECHFKNSCKLFADNSVFGDPCPGTHTYLRVLHECIDIP